VHVINAGDGRHAHPTQGLLDMYTIRHFKKDFTQLTVAIVGDIVHSRRGALDIHALDHAGRARGARRRARHPGAGRTWRSMGVRVCHDMRRGHRAMPTSIIMLRLQNERMSGAHAAQRRASSSRTTASRRNKLALARPDAIVMHPGPIEPRRRDRFCAWPTARRRVILPQVDLRHRGAHGGDEHHRRQRGLK
jgi:aspartate carbamoyltransferase catalytic subunit